MEENIDVCIRVRPLNEREVKSKDVNVLRCIESMNAISITDRNGTPLPGPTSVFQYDHIFPENVPTRTIYDDVAKRIVLSTLNGINGTIFAYGQTSSGKTHTMQGSEQTDLGILPLAVEHIFQYIEQSTDRDFLIRVSYVEIYNEVIRDLLSDDKEKGQNLKIREDYKKGIHVESHEEIITDYDTILGLLEQGELRRTVGQTSMNERSSRSHSIFRIVIESKEKATHPRRTSEDDINGAVLVGVLNLVDLAGSESVRHTSAEGIRQREAGNINRSLLTLSRVINSLAQGTESIQNAPFRDSKLTRLLQGSLAGSTRTLIICCVTPSDRHLEESKSTLQFAARAKNIQLNASVNEVLDDQAQLKRLKRELHDLRKQVESNEALNALKAENMVLSESNSKNVAEISRLMSLILTSSKSQEVKTRTKRCRETWGPGDIKRSLQSAPEKILTCLGEEPIGKKRKDVHLKEATAESTGQLEAILREKEEFIKSLQSHIVSLEENQSSYSVELESFKLEHSKLVAQVEQFQIEFANKHTEHEMLAQKLDDANQAAAAFEEIISEIESSRDDAIEQMMQIDARQTELQDRLAKQVELTSSAEERIRILDEKCRGYEETISASSKETPDLNNAQDNLKIKLDEMEKAHAYEIEAWMKKQSSCENEINELKQTLQSLAMDTNKAMTADEPRNLTEELNAGVDTYIRRIQELEETLQNKTLESEMIIAKLKEENTQQMSFLSNATEVEIEDLKQRNIEFQAGMDEIKYNSEMEIQMLAKKYADLQSLHEEILMQNENMKMELLNSSNKTDAIETQSKIAVGSISEGCATDINEIESKGKDIKELQKLLEEKDQFNTDLKQMFDEYELKAQEKLSSMESDIEFLTDEVLVAKNISNELREQLETAISDKKNALERVESINSNLESTHSTRISELESAIKEQEVSYSTLSMEYNAIVQQRDQDAEMHRKQMDELQDQLFNLNVDKDQIERNLEALISDLNSKNSELNSQLKLAQHAAEDTTTLKLLEKTEKEKKKYEQDARDLTIELSTFRKDGREKDAEMKSTIQHLEGRLQESMSEVEHMKESLVVAKDKYNSFSEQLERMVDDRTIELNGKLTALTQKHEKLLNDWNKLEMELQEKLSIQESQFKNKNESLHKSLDDVSTKLLDQMTENENLMKKYSSLDSESSNLTNNLRVELKTLRSEMDNYLDEREGLYDKLDALEKKSIHDQQNFQEILSTQRRQWETEKATLIDQMESQRERISKLELVKMTKHHLEVFQKLKQENKKRADEITLLERKLHESSLHGNESKLMEERWKYEQSEKEQLQLKMAELKLDLKTAQNEQKIKESEVQSLQTTICRLEDEMNKMKMTLTDQDHAFAQIVELRALLDQHEARIDIQTEKINVQSEKLQLQQDQLEIQRKEIHSYLEKIQIKDSELEENKKKLLSKSEEWRVAQEENEEKYQADLRYLEKENLDLHLELKQLKRNIANDKNNTPLKKHGINQNNSSKTNLNDTIPSKLNSTLILKQQNEKENDPDKINQSPPECNQQ